MSINIPKFENSEGREAERTPKTKENRDLLYRIPSHEEQNAEARDTLRSHRASSGKTFDEEFQSVLGEKGMQSLTISVRQFDQLVYPPIHNLSLTLHCDGIVAVAHESWRGSMVDEPSRNPLNPEDTRLSQQMNYVFPNPDIPGLPEQPDAQPEPQERFSGNSEAMQRALQTLLDQVKQQKGEQKTVDDIGRKIEGTPSPRRDPTELFSSAKSSEKQSGFQRMLAALRRFLS